MGDDLSSPLPGKRVVVTRALEQCEGLVLALHAAGALPIILPMVAFAPPDNVKALDAAIETADRFDWLILTSQNALRALEERCEKLGLELAHRMGGVRVAVVGPATADLAKSAGLQVEHIATRRYGAALAEELAGHLEGKRILLPRSDKANPELVERLKAFGAVVDEVVAYKTVSPSGESLQEIQRALEGGADAAVFFSPSAVTHFQDILGEDKFEELSRKTRFVAIGPVTEKALKKANVRRVWMAEDVTIDAVIAALKVSFSAKGLHLPAGAKSE